MERGTRRAGRTVGVSATLVDRLHGCPPIPSVANCPHQSVMNGELAELIALAAYGSVYIAEGASTPPELFPTASVFKYTNAVEFRRSVRRLGLLKTEIDIGKDC